MLANLTGDLRRSDGDADSLRWVIAALRRARCPEHRARRARRHAAPSSKRAHGRRLQTRRAELGSAGVPARVRFATMTDRSKPRTIDVRRGAGSTSSIDELLAEFPPATTDADEFLGAQFDLGLAWVHFPEGHGGLGRQPEAAEARSTSGSSPPAGPNPYYRNPIGYGMCGPTVVA